MIHEHQNEKDLDPTQALAEAALERPEPQRQDAQQGYLQTLGGGRAAQARSGGAKPSPQRAKPKAAKKAPKKKESGGWWSSVTSWFSDAASTVSDAVSTGLDYAKDLGEKALDAGAKGLNMAGEFIADTYVAGKKAGAEALDWAGEKYDQAAEWTSDRVDEGIELAKDAAEWTSDRVDDGVELAKRAGETAGEAWDALGSNSLDVDLWNQQISAELNPSELHDLATHGLAKDLMPASLLATLEGLEFDDSQEGANVIKLFYDHKTDLLIISSDALSVSSLDFGDYKTGPAQIKGFQITVHDTDKDTRIYDQKNLTTLLDIESISILDAQFPTPEGLARAEGMELGGLHVFLSNQGGGLPFTDELKDDKLAGSFSLDSARIWGVSGAAELEDMRVGGVGAVISKEHGVAAAQLGHLSMKGAKYGEYEADEALVEGLAVHAREGKGEGQRDQVNIALQRVALSGVNIPAAQEAKAKGEKAEASLGEQLKPLENVDLSLAVGSVRGDDLNVAGTEVDGLQVGGLSAHLQGGKAGNAQLGAARLGHFKQGETEINGAHVAGLNLSGQMGEAGMSGRAQVDRAGVDHFTDGKTTVRGASIEDLVAHGASNKDGGQGALELGAAQLGAYQSGQDLITGASVRGLDVRGQMDKGQLSANAQLEQARLAHLKQGGTLVEGAELNGLSLQGQGSGVNDLQARARLESGAVGRYKGGDVDLEQLKLANFNAQAQGSEAGLSNTASLDALSFGSLKTGDVQLSDASARQVSTRTMYKEGAPLDFQAQLAQTDIGQLKAGETTVDGLSFEQLGTQLKGEGGSANIGVARMKGLQAGDASLGATQLERSQLNWRSGPGVDNVSARLGAVDAQDLKIAGDDPVSVEALKLKDAQVGYDRAKGDKRFTGQVGDLRATGIDATTAKLDALHLSGARGAARLSDDELKSAEGQIAQLKAEGLMGGGAELKQLEASGLSGSARREGERLDAQGQLQSLKAKGLTSEQGSAEQLLIEGLSGRTRMEGEDVTAHAGLKHIKASGIEAQDAKLKQLEAFDIDGDLRMKDGGFAANGSARELSGAGLDYDGHTLESLKLSGLSGDARRQGKDGDIYALGGLGALEAHGYSGRLGEGSDQAKASFNHLSLQQLGGSMTMGEELEAQGKLGGAHLQGAAYSDGEVDAKLKDLQISGAHGAYDGEKATGGLEQLKLRGASGSYEMSEAEEVAHQGTGAGNGAPQTESADASSFYTPDILRSVMPLIQDADVKASVPMQEGDYQWVDVEKNTSMDMNLQVRDNNLVTDGKELSFSVPLDGPLWITGEGVDIRAAKPDELGNGQGKIILELGGFFDPNIGKYVYQAIDQEGNRIPLSLEAWGNLIAQVMEKPEEAEAKAVEEQKKLERKHGRRKEKPTLDQAMQLDQTSLDARASLGAGTVNLGGGQSVQVLQGGRDNEITAQRQAGEDAVVQIVNLLLGAINVNVGGQQVQANGAQVQGAQVTANPANPAHLEGQIKALDLSKVQLQ